MEDESAVDQRHNQSCIIIPRVLSGLQDLRNSQS